MPRMNWFPFDRIHLSICRDKMPIEGKLMKRKERPKGLGSNRFWASFALTQY
jgi:hypothetical protein